MREVRIDKTRLRERVQVNRDAHRAAFEAAMEGYRCVILEWLNEQLDRAKAGKPHEVAFHRPTPVDQTAAYDNVLDMIDMSEDRTITLTSQEFRWYVRDEWEWQRNTTEINAAYMST